MGLGSFRLELVSERLYNLSVTEELSSRSDQLQILTIVSFVDTWEYGGSQTYPTSYLGVNVMHLAGQELILAHFGNFLAHFSTFPEEN